MLQSKVLRGLVLEGLLCEVVFRASWDWGFWELLGSSVLGVSF